MDVTAFSNTDGEALAPDEDGASRIFLPQLLLEIASRLSPNEVACSFSVMNKVAAALLRAAGFVKVRLSRPVPHHSFVRRWGDAAVLQTLSWKQRRHLLELTAVSGCLANLEFLLDMEDYFPLELCVLEAAAGAGQLAVCQALRRRGCAWSDKVFDAAAAGGHLKTCEWLLSSGCSWSCLAPAKAAEGGHVALVDWLLVAAQRRYISCESLLEATALGCDLATLLRIYNFCVEKRGEEVVQGWRCTLANAVVSQTADWQAKADWLLARGVRPQSLLSTMQLADMFKRDGWQARMEVLRQRWGAGIEGDLAALAQAAVRADNLRQSLLPQALPPGHKSASFFVCLAASYSNLPVMQLLASLGYPLCTDVLEAALRDGHLPVAIWLVERLEQQPGGLQLTPRLFKTGAESGSLEMLQWLAARGCPFDRSTFEAVAEHCSVEALEWLAERGCPMADDGSPYSCPACNGDLPMLRCLRRLNCRWDKDDYGDTFTDAVRVFARMYMDPPEADPPRPVGLLWMLAEGCPVDWDEVREMLERELDMYGYDVHWLLEMLGVQDEDEDD